MSGRAIGAGLTARRRLWEVDPGKLCSILGTCLSLHDLHVLARRARYTVPAEMSAYELHSWFVDAVRERSELSRVVDKELERQHGKIAGQVRTARAEGEIEPRFQELAGRGFVAGAYWGAMSHPLCSEATAWRVFGEVHMLSHLVGGSRRADVARVHALETACVSLDAKLATAKHEHRAERKVVHRLEEALEVSRRGREQAERRLAVAEARAAELASTSAVAGLEARIAELARALAEAEARAALAEAGCDDAAVRLALHREAAARATTELHDLRAENAALEAELAAAVVCPFAGSDAPLPASRPDLAGKRILCVGGRTGLVPHYRALVERRGAELVHHDGGLEDSLDAVTRALGTVDVVVCPIDQVSHAASTVVKRACKQRAIPFVPLRSSGLSSFARELRRLAAEPDAAVAAAE